ncbi:ribose 1,5-bisphosphate isomerase [Patescibacteria group bacterium]|nr:ribose 1,5-bisphosphate isomerase [Patescibacteria group bacterium]
MTYEEIVSKIKSLEIQGAENIAKKAVEAFGIKLKETRDKTTLKTYVKELEETRATEPALRNALHYCLENYEKDKNVVETVMNHFKDSKEKIAEIGAEKIHDGTTVFTHCHSSTVTKILIKAWRDGKKFRVINTETRPRYQGRITAEELAAEGIPVTHFVDSAGRSMMPKADLFLFGCDAVTAEGKLINKIGTESLVDRAHELGIPAYSCTNSWKFNPKTVYGADEEIEQRDPDEIWENPPKGVEILNPAFEVSLPDKFTGVITELGIFKPETLVLEVQKAYPWLVRA